MPGKLLNYLQTISNNAAALKEFYANPVAAAQHAGLSAVETKAVVSKNPAALATAIHGGGSVAASDDINVTIVVVVAP